MKRTRRLIHVWAGIPLKDEDMGEVRVSIKLINTSDETRARDGLLKPEQIRSLQVLALVDTGAMRCVMPAGIQAQLGAATAFHTRVQYADGRSEEVPVSEPVHIEIQGRPLYEECLVLGKEFLVGQTALGKADMFVDCVGGRLVPNPDHPDTVIMPVL